MGKTYSIEDILAEMADPDFKPVREDILSAISERAAAARKVFVCFYATKKPEYAKPIHRTEARAFDVDSGSKVVFQLAASFGGVARIAIRDSRGLLLYELLSPRDSFTSGSEFTLSVPRLKGSL